MSRMSSTALLPTLSVVLAGAQVSPPTRRSISSCMSEAPADTHWARLASMAPRGGGGGGGGYD